MPSRRGALGAIAAIGMVTGLATAIAVGAGCDSTMDFHLVHPPPRCDAGDDASDDAGDCADGEDAGAKDQPACTGLCAPFEDGQGWTRPTPVWLGPTDEAPPPCPPNAPLDVLDGFAGIGPLSHTCPACICEQTCSVPSAWSVLAATCADSNQGPVASALWNAPGGWDGACLAEAPPDPSSMCMGGACPLALEIAPPAHECEPVQQGVEEKDGPPWPWQTQARVCFGDSDTYGGDCGPKTTCAPLAPEPSQAFSGHWSTCIRRNGDSMCLAPYSDRVVVYKDAEDQRACAPCACTGPDGGACKVLARAVTDGTCGQAALSAELTSEKQTDYCFDLPAGTDVTGKWATITDFAPGACTPSGGEPTGSVVPFDPVTICCLPQK